MIISGSTTATEVWELLPLGAKLKLPPLRGEINFVDPCAGIMQLAWSDEHLGGQVLGVSAGDPSTLQDSFQRGADLVATYEVAQTQTSRWQVYWRVTGPEPHVVQLDAIVSLQTPLLESFPKVTTHSRLCAEQVWLVPASGRKLRQISHEEFGQDPQPDHGCLVLRSADGNWSYAEMTHPSDRGTFQLAIASDGLTCVLRNLGGSFLEKGVIRRMRIRGSFLPRKDDLERAAHYFTSFAVEKPPLTA